MRPAPGQPPAMVQAGPPGAARPGTMTLAPQDLNGIFGSAWRTLRASWLRVIVLSTLPVIVAAVAAFVVIIVVAAEIGDGELPFSLSLDDPDLVWSAFLVFCAAVAGTMLLSALLGAGVSAGLTGMFGQGVLGRRPSLASGFAAMLTRVWSACFAVVVIALGLGALWAGVLVVLVAAHLDSSAVGALLLLPIWLPLLGFVTGRMMFVVPAAVLERAGPFAAISRSWKLTRGRFWRTVGVTLIAGVAAFGAHSILLTTMLTATGTGKPDEPAAFTAAQAAVTILAFASGALASAFVTYVVAALYVEARIRDENLAWPIMQASGGRQQAPGHTELTPGHLPFPPPPGPHLAR